MKIKITESQAKFLKLIKEGIDVSKQANEYEKLSKQLDKIYSHISVVSIGDILDNSFDIEKIYELMNHIESLYYTINKEVSNIFKDLDVGDESRTWDSFNYIDDLGNMVSKKIDILNEVVASLRKVNEFMGDKDSNLFNSNTIKIS